MLEALAVAIKTVRGPWVVGADWNFTPEELVASGWLEIVDGIVIAPDAPTCHQKTYDYFVVSRKTKQAVVGIQQLTDVGIEPHTPSRLILRGDGRRPAVRSLKRPPKVPGDLPHGPAQPPPAYPRPDADEDCEKIAKAARAWHIAARKEASHLAGKELKYFDPSFKWVSAAGEFASQHVGASYASKLWRKLAGVADHIVQKP